MTCSPGTTTVVVESVAEFRPETLLEEDEEAMGVKS